MRIRSTLVGSGAVGDGVAGAGCAVAGACPAGSGFCAPATPGKRTTAPTALKSETNVILRIFRLSPDFPSTWMPRPYL